MATIRIGSFNVHNLSDGQGRDLDRIARMINHNHLDIVALQEVLGEGKVLTGLGLNNPEGQAKAYDRSLKRRLLGQWDSEWAQPTIRGVNEKYLGGDKRGEGYAILWRSNKFVLPKDEDNKEIRPHIFSGYHAWKDGLRLIRDPLLARFCLKGREVAEIRILVTHIVYGKPVGAEDRVDEGSVTLRKKEFETLAGRVYRSIAEYYKQIQATSPYTILLGDYNLDLKESGALGPYLPGIAVFDSVGHLISDKGICSKFVAGEKIDGYHKISTVQSDLSTLKRDEQGYAHNYDHFSFDERTERIVNAGSVKALQDFVTDSGGNDAFKTYKEKVSDHVPIIMEIKI